MNGMNITALPWEVLPPFAPSYSDHGYRRIVEVRRGGIGGETLVIYAKAANMLVEGEGFAFGKDDAEFIALACNAHHNLVAALTGLLGCAELNQNDLEGDTRYMIENASAVLLMAEVQS